MRLRSMVDRVLPLKDDEVRLSPEARMIVFRKDCYYTFDPGKITGVERFENWDERTKENWPWEVRVTRTQKSGSKIFYGDGWSAAKWSDGVIDPVEEMQSPKALERATRVENVARRIKIAAAGLAFVGVVTGASVTIYEGITPTTPTEQHSDVRPCAQVVVGGETLAPISQQDVQTIQKAGGSICQLAQHDYLVTGQDS
jgi:hypothetical protein